MPMEMKVGVVGAGAVGAACLLSLVMHASAREIVLVNRTRARARGVVTDLQYGAVLSPRVELRDGDYSDLSGAAVILLTAGVNEKTGGATDRSDPVGRLRLPRVAVKPRPLGLFPWTAKTCRIGRGD
jgi:L-lactate dehydrogenase